MARRPGHERGQTMIEFGLVFSALMLLTAGLVDVGRAFYEYNELSALARYGARWGGVVGGTCALTNAGSQRDFCNTFAGTTELTHTFWNTLGNEPIPTSLGGNGFNAPCPSYSSNPSAFYSVSAYVGTTTIVGALAQRWDSSTTSSGLQTGGTSPGLDRSKVFVCIATTWTSTSANGATYSDPRLGDYISVTIRYPFQAASGLFGKAFSKDLLSTSVYRMEF